MLGTAPAFILKLCGKTIERLRENVPFVSEVECCRILASSFFPCKRFSVRAVFNRASNVIKQLLWTWFWFHYGLRLAESNKQVSVLVN